MFSDSDVIIANWFGEVIASLRKTGTIDSIEVLGGDVYKINAANTLVEGELIKISGVDYKAQTVNASNFRVVSKSNVDGLSFTGLSPYYEHDHFLNIANKLSLKDAATELYKYQKYPLFALIHDFKEYREFGKPTTSKLNVLIINSTEQNYDSDDRYANNFVPVLIPLYKALFAALDHSRYFSGKFPHTKIDRLSWGTQKAMSNDAVILNDYIDAIEIEDLEVQLINQPCKS